MPRTWHIHSLKNLCTKILAKFLQVLSEENRRLRLNDHLPLKPVYRELVEYLKRLPKSLLERVIFEYSKHHKALEMVEAEGLVPENLLLIALGVDLKNFLCYFPSISFPVVDFMKQHSENISSLTLISRMFISKHYTLRTLLFSLKNLEELSIEGKELPKYCVKILAKEPLIPKLKTLNLKSCPEFFDSDVKMSALLYSRKKLQRLSFNGFILFFNDLQSHKISLNLEELVLDIPRLKSTNEIDQVTAIESIAKCCRKLTSLDIRYNFKYGVESLKKFKKLKSLKLRNSYIGLTTSWKLFFGNWPNLHTLFISYTSTISTKLFAESVPLLKELTIQECNFEESPVEPNCLQHLEHLSIQDPVRGFTPDVIFELLTSSYRLKKIEMNGRIDMFRSRTFLDVLSVNSLDNLEHFSVHYCHLSHEAVESLVGNKKSNLDFAHIVSGSIYSDDIKLIRKIVLEENLSIYLKLRSVDSPKTVIINNLHD